MWRTSTGRISQRTSPATALASPATSAKRVLAGPRASGFSVTSAPFQRWMGWSAPWWATVLEPLFGSVLLPAAALLALGVAAPAFAGVPRRPSYTMRLRPASYVGLPPGQLRPAHVT